MRILMVTTSMTVGGIQSVVRDLSNQLIDCGHEVGIVSLCGLDDVATDPRVFRWSLGLDGMSGNVVKAVKGVRSIVSLFDPDILHSHAFHANLVGQLASGRAGRPAFIRTLHSVKEGGPIHGLISRAMNTTAHSSVAVSQAVAMAHGLADRSTIHYNAIDLERFAFSDVDRDRVRHALALTPDDLLMISVGRLTAAKDLRTLVAAACSAFARNPHLYLAIVGDGPLRQELEHQIASSEHARRLFMLGSRRDVPALLSGADIYVQSSAWEGFPLAPLEAMASGLQVIATDVGGTGELRPPPALLVASGDEHALARALGDAPKYVRSNIDRRYCTDLLSCYSLTSWTRGWIDVYERVLAR